MSQSKFQLRGFTSILLSLAFVVVVATGLVLWLSHAQQTFGVGKGTWKHTHVVASLLMLTAGAIHWYLNFSVFCSYFCSKVSGRLNQWREMALAFAIVAVLIAPGFFLHGGPGDMQRLAAMSPYEMAQQSGQPVDRIVAALTNDGIQVDDPTDSLLEIAERNQCEPDAVLAVLRRTVPEALPAMRGRRHHMSEE